MSEIEFNDKELQKLIKSYSAKMPDIKVGILGEMAARDDKLNNAEIGMVHEFGSPSKNIPMRSFLRMPISEKLHGELENVKMGKGAGVREMAYVIGSTAVSVIHEAFATAGFGQWDKAKKKEDPLIDTGQLRESINFEIQ
jgi:phage gpG-like protein